MYKQSAADHFRPLQNYLGKTWKIGKNESKAVQERGVKEILINKKSQS